MDWPPDEEQRRRLETGLEAITRLWNGETVTMDAGWFKLKDARLWTRAPGRPKLYNSAFGPQSAEVAARYGDGLWTLGDPEKAPAIIEAHRAAIEGARHWKPTRAARALLEDIADQDDMQRRADAQMTDEEFAHEGFLISADPEAHIERIREMERAGATIICLQLIGRADPFGSIRGRAGHARSSAAGSR